jgi:hypothetical protein
VAVAAVVEMVVLYRRLAVVVVVLRIMTPEPLVRQIKAFVVVIVVVVEVAVAAVLARQEEISAVRVAVKEEQGFHLALRDQP